MVKELAYEFIWGCGVDQGGGECSLSIQQCWKCGNSVESGWIDRDTYVVIGGGLQQGPSDFGIKFWKYSKKVNSKTLIR